MDGWMGGLGYKPPMKFGWQAGMHAGRQADLYAGEEPLLPRHVAEERGEGYSTPKALVGRLQSQGLELHAHYTV